MGLPITLITHLFLVYKLTKLYDVTRVTSRRIESLDEILLPNYMHLPELEYDWTRIYGYVLEEIPKDAPEPLG